MSGSADPMGGHRSYEPGSTRADKRRVRIRRGARMRVVRVRAAASWPAAPPAGRPVRRGTA